MIISKPKVGTLFSIGVFVAASMMGAGYGLKYVYSLKPEWYHYALLLIFGPIGLGLLFRMILKYQIVKMGKGSIEIRFPARFKDTTYKVNDLTHWKETVINTAGGKYKEVELVFSDKKTINLSMQEHSNYPQVISYLRKKASKKMKSS